MQVLRATCVVRLLAVVEQGINIAAAVAVVVVLGMMLLLLVLLLLLLVVLLLVLLLLLMTGIPFSGRRCEWAERTVGIAVATATGIAGCCSIAAAAGAAAVGTLVVLATGRRGAGGRVQGIDVLGQQTGAHEADQHVTEGRHLVQLDAVGGGQVVGQIIGFFLKH